MATDVELKQKISELAGKAPNFAGGPVGEDAYNQFLGNSYKELTGRWVTPEEAAFHGQYFTSPGANASKWLEEFAKYPEVQTYAPQVKQQVNNQNMQNQVKLMTDPQKLALQQARESYTTSVGAKQRELADALAMSQGRYKTQYQQVMEDLARQALAQNEAETYREQSLGMLHSGILSNQLAKLAQGQNLASGRAGTEYLQSTGELERTYAGGLKNLAEQLGLYESQYGQNLKALGSREEQLIQQLLQQQVEREDALARYGEEMGFKREQFAEQQRQFNEQLALQQALANLQAGYGGSSGGSYTGSTATGVTPTVTPESTNSNQTAMDALMQALLLGDNPLGLSGSFANTLQLLS